jgi:hypothetical protein
MDPTASSSLSKLKLMLVLAKCFLKTLCWRHEAEAEADAGAGQRGSAGR